MRARTKRVGEECVAHGIPFVILPANDKHAIAAYEKYCDDVTDDDNTDIEYAKAASSDLARMKEWQREFPTQVQTPFLLPGES